MRLSYIGKITDSINASICLEQIIDGAACMHVLNAQFNVEFRVLF